MRIYIAIESVARILFLILTFSFSFNIYLFLYQLAI
jgi:hypothetical protein